MGYEVVCPHCGGLVPAEVPELAIAGSSGSAEVEADAIGWSGSPGRGFEPSHDLLPPAEDWGSGADLIAVPSPDLEPGPDSPAPAYASEPAFALDLGPPAATPSAPVEATADQTAGEPGGLGWATLLLASYASAATLALVYMVWLAPRRSPGPESLPADTRSGIVLSPIARERIGRLGEPQRVASLELTPLEVRRGRVALRRAGGRRGQGDPGSLVLRLRLRNLSTTETFAPMDPAFARRPDQGTPDSLVVAEGGDAPPIEPYPLALRSEQALEGQPFGPLKPGEERELVLATEPLAEGREIGSSVWRFRLRVGPGQTEAFGVRFGAGDVR